MIILEYAFTSKPLRDDLAKELKKKLKKKGIPYSIRKCPSKRLLRMKLEKFFTAERLEEAGVPVAHHLTRISKIWEYEEFEQRSDPPFWVKEMVKLRTVGDLVEFGLEKTLKEPHFKLGKKVLGVIRETLHHNDIEFK